MGSIKGPLDLGTVVFSSFGHIKAHKYGSGVRRELEWTVINGAQSTMEQEEGKDTECSRDSLPAMLG